MDPDTGNLPGDHRLAGDFLNRAWDHAYETQGRLWGGVLQPVPDLPADSLVLELGCGNGKTAAQIAGKVRYLAALDFSTFACRLAQKALAGHDNADVITADARAIPFRTGSVDLVLAFHVVGHGLRASRAALVGEIVRVLPGGGRLLFLDFSADDLRAGGGTEVEPRTFRRGNGIIDHYFTEDEVSDLSGALALQKIVTRRWSLRIRGRDHVRSEIMASFTRR